MDDITTKPTPIQRNPMDVATELTQLHIKSSVLIMKTILLIFMQNITH